MQIQYGFITLRPKDCRHMTTEFKFCRSQRSTLWKVSCVGTPKFLAQARKAIRREYNGIYRRHSTNYKDN